jgi:hypothetical protein
MFTRLQGDSGVIPDSMGTSSYIVRGLGDSASYESCSRGARQRMSQRDSPSRTRSRSSLPSPLTTERLLRPPAYFGDHRLSEIYNPRMSSKDTEKFRQLSFHDSRMWVLKACREGRETELSSLLVDSSLPLDRLTFVAAALGDGTGRSSIDALRSVLRSASATDLVSTTILAIGKRLGPDATEIVSPFLDSRSWQVRHHAFMVEGFVGDLRIKDRMLLEWIKVLKASKNRQPNSTIDVIRYLGRHFGSLTPREMRLVSDRGPIVWARAHPGPKEWIETFWPSMTSAGPILAGPSGRLMSQTLSDYMSPKGTPRTS